MFLHDYLLACEISTVRTQTLNQYSATMKCNATDTGYDPQPVGREQNMPTVSYVKEAPPSRKRDHL